MELCLPQSEYKHSPNRIKRLKLVQKFALQPWWHAEHKTVESILLFENVVYSETKRFQIVTGLDKVTSSKYESSVYETVVSHWTAACRITQCRVYSTSLCIM